MDTLAALPTGEAVEILLDGPESVLREFVTVINNQGRPIAWPRTTLSFRLTSAPSLGFLTFISDSFGFASEMELFEIEKALAVTARPFAAVLSFKTVSYVSKTGANAGMHLKRTQPQLERTHGVQLLHPV